MEITSDLATKIMAVITIVLSVVSYAIFLYILTKDPRMAKKNMKNIEKMLMQNGFIISRKIGKFEYWLTGVQPFILYIDDNNKKWFMASLFFPEESKIYNFDELLSYKIFDDDSPPIRKEVNGLKLPLTALFLSFLDMLEGVLSDEFYRILRYKSGITMSYGLKIKTRDEMLECDFLEAGRRFLKKQREARKIKVFAVKIFRDREITTKTGIEKKSTFYKKSFKLIEKMEKAFIDIIVYNQAKNL